MDRSTTDAFRELYRATYDDLLVFVERRVHLAVADDVVAEVFLTAWRRFADIPAAHDQARAWLFTVAHNVLRNRYRSDDRQQGLALRVVREPATHPGPEADGVAARVDLVRAWQRLSRDDQQVITLTAFEGLTGRQAAQVLGITRPAFSLRLLRARHRLRQHLQAATPAPHRPHPTATPETGASR
ncbi:RNA polymerase sigma factor [Paractinoplanes brasiliensis]|uniref:RNA polymerase sigma-70 factor (ECF subfamily) n=1 Tax=Paractinoplanes brasiliensis TaxID=52695 RepID=A0A4V3C758_9ACTN|nr:sigma-70 family RNA polymerase sigma factor [Actinoplanes brasiliensis]TDO36478.1 RNA polymerase sigma-70 factor (ECF subfamily) [Actinoplanes brasiliensis]GID32533.1 hypothetical protein Abr02nite_75160 [Actinoplanes brasiliensis]